jgi:hypothetical protein
MPFKGLTNNFMPHMVYLMKSPHHRWVMEDFGRICSIMNAYVKRSNKCFGNYLFFNGYGAFLKV